MAEFRALARIARRAITHNRLRSLLVVVLVAIPVAAGAAVAAGNRVGRTTNADRIDAAIGQADVGFIGAAAANTGPFLAELAGVDPDANVSEFLAFRTNLCVVRTCELEVTSIDLTDPLTDAIVDLHAGTVPTESGEVALSTALLEELEASIGDQVALPTLDGTWSVVGEVRHETNRHRNTIVVNQVDLIEHVGIEHATRTLLVSASSEAATRAIANAQIESTSPFSMTQNRDWALYEEDVVFDLDRPGRLSTVASAALMIEVAFVAAAAFAVGTRRRIVEFGQLATLGADPRQLRRLVMIEAATLGVIGALLGAITGLIGFAIAVKRGWLEFMTDRFIETVEWAPTDLIGPTLVGIAAALIAAWLPARRVSRIPATTALAGRVPAATLPRFLIPLGLAAVVLGTAMVVSTLSASGDKGDLAAAVLVGGVALMFLGAAACAAPTLSLVSLLAPRLSATTRLVVRDSGRQRVRSGATVASLIAVTSIPIFIATVAASDPSTDCCPTLDPRFAVLPTAGNVSPEPGALRYYRETFGDEIATRLEDPQTRTDLDHASIEVLRDHLEIAAEAEIRTIANTMIVFTSGSDPLNSRVGIATPEMLDALELDDAARQALARGELIASHTSGEPRFESTSYPREAFDIGPVHYVDVDANGWSLPVAYLAEEEAIRRRFEIEPARSRLFVMDPAPSLAERRAVAAEITQTVWELLGNSTPTGQPLPPIVEVFFGSDPSGLTRQEVANRVAIAAAALALLIAATAAALAAVELDQELGTMVAIGAPPHMRRQFLGLQSGYHAFIAALLGAPLAVLMYWAAITGNDWRNHVTIPTTMIITIIIAVPLAVGALVAVMFRSGRPVVSRRLS